MHKTKFVSFLVSAILLGNHQIIPNIITGVRIVCAPVVVYMILNHHWHMAFGVCVFASISDFFDGYLARLLKCESQWGALFDPIADKIFIFSLFGVMAYINPHFLNLFITAGIRDLLIMAGGYYAIQNQLPIEIKPTWVSKWNTAFQLLLGCGFLMYNGVWNSLLSSLYVITFATTVYSFIDYAILFIRTLLSHLKK
jgi:cardiolipin synthase